LEWYRKDGDVFIVGADALEVIGGKSIVYVFAELFGCEVRGVPFVDVVDVSVWEMFMSIYFHGI
jgi:hypothetical protein